MSDGQITGASVASVSVSGDPNPMEFEAIIPDYFLTFPTQKCTALLFFSINFGGE